MSILYRAENASQIEKFSANVFILASGTDDRTLAMATLLSRRTSDISEIVVLQYSSGDTSTLNELFPNARITQICMPKSQVDYLKLLQEKADILSASGIMIDISCIHTPDMFTLLKYFQLSNPKQYLDIAYSIPFEYEFSTEPFTSYRSYYGNLKTSDLIGYGGISDGTPHSKMIIFLGFEGILSSKVNEDIQYNNLLLVNNLPSFYEKYKDISVINNYDLVSARHGKMQYVPANNPFETYNFLSQHLQVDEPACVAPLSTKPVALGVCMYALGHQNLRVVYPVSDEYNYHSTNRVHSTYVYHIPLAKL